MLKEFMERIEEINSIKAYEERFNKMFDGKKVIMIIQQPIQL